MWLWLIIGSIAFVLGAIGLFLPVWPTTVFWIIAAIAFAKSRPEWRDWIYARPGIGPVIESFVEHGQLTRASKIGALTGMAMAGGLAAFLLRGQLVWLGVAGGLLVIGALVVITRPAPQKHPSEPGHSTLD